MAAILPLSLSEVVSSPLLDQPLDAVPTDRTIFSSGLGPHRTPGPLRHHPMWPSSTSPRSRNTSDRSNMSTTNVSEWSTPSNATDDDAFVSSPSPDSASGDETTPTQPITPTSANPTSRRGIPFDNSAPIIPPSTSPQKQNNGNNKVKVSHARKTEQGHIKRPPNAFILFRSHCCNPETMREDPNAPGTPTALQLAELNITDHRYLSRITSVLWNNLSKDDKAYWEHKAQEKKEEHRRLHPQYKYKPVSRPQNELRRRRLHPHEGALEKAACEDVANALLQTMRKVDPSFSPSTVSHTTQKRTLKRPLADNESKNKRIVPKKSASVPQPFSPRMRDPLPPRATTSTHTHTWAHEASQSAMATSSYELSPPSNFARPHSAPSGDFHVQDGLRRRRSSSVNTHNIDPGMFAYLPALDDAPEHEFPKGMSSPPLGSCDGHGEPSPFSHSLFDSNYSMRSNTGLFNSASLSFYRPPDPVAPLSLQTETDQFMQHQGAAFAFVASSPPTRSSSSMSSASVSSSSASSSCSAAEHNSTSHQDYIRPSDMEIVSGLNDYSLCDTTTESSSTTSSLRPSDLSLPSDSASMTAYVSQSSSADGYSMMTSSPMRIRSSLPAPLQPTPRPVFQSHLSHGAIPLSMVEVKRRGTLGIPPDTPAGDLMLLSPTTGSQGSRKFSIGHWELHKSSLGNDEGHEEDGGGAEGRRDEQTDALSMHISPLDFSDHSLQSPSEDGDNSFDSSDKGACGRRRNSSLSHPFESIVGGGGPSLSLSEVVPASSRGYHVGANDYFFIPEPPIGLEHQQQLDFGGEVSRATEKTTLPSGATRLASNRSSFFSDAGQHESFSPFYHGQRINTHRSSIDALLSTSASDYYTPSFSSHHHSHSHQQHSHQHQQQHQEEYLTQSSSSFPPGVLESKMWIHALSSTRESALEVLKHAQSMGASNKNNKKGDEQSSSSSSSLATGEMSDKNQYIYLSRDLANDHELINEILTSGFGVTYDWTGSEPIPMNAELVQASF